MPKLKVGSWTFHPKGEHKMKKGKRAIRVTSICDTKGCEFYGQPAAQGVCYSKIDTGVEKYYKHQMQQAEDHLKFYQKGLHRGDHKKQTQKEYIKTLENHFVCFWMNYSNCLDELVWLRGENAKLQLRAGKWKKN